jgi:hypothetical protein
MQSILNTREKNYFPDVDFSEKEEDDADLDGIAEMFS